MTHAAIDIGSNSIHLAVADVSQGALHILDREKVMVKLGKPVFTTGEIGPSLRSEALSVIERFVHIAEGHSAKPILAVATSAVREARDGPRFLAEARQRGLDVDIISGREEARLILLAVERTVSAEEPYVVIDIGGGSVEIARRKPNGEIEAHSLRLGVQRLLADFGADRLEKKDLKSLQERVQRALKRALPELTAPAATLAMGTSGTIRALGECVRTWSKKEGDELDLDVVEEFTELLRKASVKERIKDYGVDEERADAIHLGAVVLVECMHLLGCKKLMLAHSTLREGVLFDHLAPREKAQAPSDPRMATVLGLARRFNVSASPDHHVKHLAQRLFDDTKEIHELDDDDRELLGYAALLYSVGTYISHRKLHKHGRYLIDSARLPAFDKREQRLIALLVRYHRRARPKKKHRRFRKLSKSDRRRVEVLAGILRTAVALDRGRTASVLDLVVRPNADGRGHRIVLSADDDPKVELWAARRALPELERVLDTEFVITPAGRDT